MPIKLNPKSDVKDNSFQRSWKQNPEDMTLEEARSWIIETYCNIEDEIDSLIINYFKPTNAPEFHSIVLNSSVISFGAKLKILNGLKIIDKKTIQLLYKLSSIRNAFAHSNIVQTIDLNISEDTKPEEIKIGGISDTMEIMHANGEVIRKDAKEYLLKFFELEKVIHKSLIKKLEENKLNEK